MSRMSAKSLLFWVSLVFLFLLSVNRFYSSFSAVDSHATFDNQHKPNLHQAPQTGSLAPTPAPEPAWEFNATVHANHYGLTASQCSSAFPGLYAEIERPLKLRQSTATNVTIAHLDASAGNDNHNEHIRFAIYRNNIYVIDDRSGVMRMRAAAILSSIHRAIIASEQVGGMLPDIEVVMSVGDSPRMPHQWGLTRNMEVDEDTWVIPDFVLWATPTSLQGEYEEVRGRMREAEIPFKDKKPELVWRGVLRMSSLRQSLGEILGDKPWGNFKAMDWVVTGGTAIPEEKDKEFAITAWDQCRWQFLAYTEGVAYSARLKFLTSCASIVVTHKLKWAEYFMDLFVTEGPNQNIVQVERDWSDLEEKMEELLNNPERAQRIAENSARTFRDRYLTPAATACYYRQLIRAWSEVQDYNVTIYDTKVDKTTGEVTKALRGKPYEIWMLEAYL